VHVRRRSAYEFFHKSFLRGVPCSCRPRVARWGAARKSAINGFGKGGDLSLVLIVQATAEEVHRSYHKPRHESELYSSGALFQGPAVGYTQIPHEAADVLEPRDGTPRLPRCTSYAPPRVLQSWHGKAFATLSRAGPFDRGQEG